MLDLALKNFADRQFYSAELGRATLQLSSLHHMIGEVAQSLEDFSQAKVICQEISLADSPCPLNLEADDFTKFIGYNYR